MRGVVSFVVSTRDTQRARRRCLVRSNPGSELSRVTGRDEVGHVGFYEIGISELDVSVVEGTAKCLDGIMHALC